MADESRATVVSRKEESLNRNHSSMSLVNREVVLVEIDAFAHHEVRALRQALN